MRRMRFPLLPRTGSAVSRTIVGRCLRNSGHHWLLPAKSISLLAAAVLSISGVGFGTVHQTPEVSMATSTSVQVVVSSVIAGSVRASRGERLTRGESVNSTPSATTSRVTVESTTSGKCECDKVLDSTGKGAPLEVVPGKQVVLLIHGINEGPASWSTNANEESALTPRDPRPTLVEKLRQDPNFSVGTFDYNDSLNDKGNPDFIPNNAQRYGPALVKAIKCLAQRSGMKVTLVGYSRGGLVSQEALNPLDPSQGSAADLVAGLVSIDTPWNNPLPPLSRLKIEPTFPPGRVPIPSGIPVMPIGSEIELDRPVTGVPPVGDVNGGNITPVSGDANQTGTACDTVPPGSVVATRQGDGCFEAESNQLDVPTTNKVVDNSVQPVKCSWSGTLEHLGECSAYHHVNMQLNREIVDPIVTQLDRWRTLNWLNDPSLVGADGHIQNGCQSPPEATSRPAVGSTSSSVSTPPSDGEQGGGYRKHCNDNEYLDHGDCKPEPKACDHDQYMDHGECKMRPPVCDHNQVSDGHGGCKDKPQDCRPGQVHHADGECYDLTTPGSGNSACPNGMVRFAPETDTTSGCVVPGAGGNQSQTKTCPSGQHLTTLSGCQADTLNRNDPQSGPCPKGLHRDKEGVCRADGSGQGASSGSSSQPIPGSPNFVCLGGSSCSSSPSTGTSQSQAPTSTTTRPQPTTKASAPTTAKPTTTTPTTAKTTAQSKPDQQSSQSVQPVLPHSARPSSTPSPSSTSSGTKICKATGEPPPPGDKCPSSGQG